VERYGNGIIAYNLGNFIMPSLKDVPSYYSENGEAQSTYNKKKMLWNRISWGVAINLEDLNYKVVKYMPFFNRIVRLPITPLDRYLKMRIIITDESYSSKMSRHLKRRALYRYIMDFIQNPHVPQKLKRIL